MAAQQLQPHAREQLSLRTRPGSNCASPGRLPLNADVLVPVKPLGEAKGRLSSLLSGDQRRDLAEALLEDTLDALAAAACIQQIWVVSADPVVLELVQQKGATPLPENPRSGGLNGALSDARDRIQSAADAPAMLLVVPADLALITAEAVCEFLADAPAQAFIRICPSPDGGTNALLMAPGDAIPFRFGVGSAAAHIAEAERRSVSVQIRELPELQIDLDAPQDLTALSPARTTSRVREVLAGIDLTTLGSNAER